MRETSKASWTAAQQTAIELEGRDILVTAGAGTGKTSVLVARILRKLRDKTARDLDRLLVVTFTEKAAAEMKERIHFALARDPELRRFLPQLPRAPISTIHAFCARLLREQFLLAGVEPGFRILDEQGSVEALEEALRKTFHRWYARTDEAGEEFQRLVELAGFNEEGEALRSIVRRLYQFARATTDPEAYLDALVQREPATTLQGLPWFEDFVRALASDWTDALELYSHALRTADLDDLKTQPHRAFLDCLASFDPRDFADSDRRGAFAKRMEAESRHDDSSQNLFRFPTAPSGAVKNSIFKACHEEAKQILSRKRNKLVPRIFQQASKLIDEDRFLLSSLEVLVELVRETSQAYERYKERGGLLDYSDLEVRAARLLRDHGDQLGMPDRFDEVLVDEYQDVNALQESILSAVSRPGRRFRVGDVKQSIYRFRLADPSIFLVRSRGSIPIRDRDVVPVGAEPVAIFLNENHRSRPEILRFVNRVFGDLFDADTIGSPYRDQALVASRPSEAADPLIELHWIETTDPKEEAKDLEPLDLRELQPRLVARRLRALADDPVLRDPRGNPDWSRVAVLLRARTHAAYYVDALAREGIPAQVGDGGSLLDEPPVRDLVMLLRAIDNPRDDVTIAAILRSPLFSIGDADLLRIRLAFPDARSYLDAVVGTACLDPSEALHEALPFLLPPGAPRQWCGAPRPNALAIAPPELRLRLQLILLRLVNWRRRVEEQELGRFLQELIYDTDLQALVSGSGGGAHPRACLEKLLALARSFEAERGPSLRGFVARLDALQQAGGIDSVPLASEGVRILTVHKSKGLEFPVVVVPQLDWRFTGKDRLASRIRIGPHYVGLRRFDPEQYARVDGLARQTLEHEQVREAREEEARILYVGMTRARERLILVSAGSPPKRELIDDPFCRSTLAKRTASAAPWIAQVIPWGTSETPRRSLLTAMRVRGDAPQGRSPDEMEFPALSAVVTIVPKECLTEDQRDSVMHPESRDPLMRSRSNGPATRTLDSSIQGESVPAPLLERIAKIPPRPPLASIEGLRGKYWVTEFTHLGDEARLADLREEAAGWWIPTLFDAPSADRPIVRLRIEDSLQAPAQLSFDYSVGQTPRVDDGAPAGSISDESASQRGVRYHMVLSRLDLAGMAASPGEERRIIERQLATLRREPWWGDASPDSEIEEGVMKFFESALGRDLIDAARNDSVEREVPFSLKWSVAELVRHRPELLVPSSIDSRWTRAQWDDVLDRYWVLLQGRIDCLFRSRNHWILIDWKSDRVMPGKEPERAVEYRSQMDLYAEAVARLWGAPVRAFVVFLTTGMAVELPGRRTAPASKPD